MNYDVFMVDNETWGWKRDFNCVRGSAYLIAGLRGKRSEWAQIAQTRAALFTHAFVCSLRVEQG